MRAMSLYRTICSLVCVFAGIRRGETRLALASVPENSCSAYAPIMGRVIATVVLLVLSNIFMTAAWYGHLKWFGEGKRFVIPLIGIIAVSWLIALPEYCLQVPANRLGHRAHGGPLTAPQLKIIQEAITLVVFAVFSIFVLKEKLRANDAVAFVLVFCAVLISVWGRGSGADDVVHPGPVSAPVTAPLESSP
jgi:uncharacterized protein